MNQTETEKKVGDETQNEEMVLYDSAPSMIRNKPFSFIFSVMAMVIGVLGIFGVISLEADKSLDMAMSIIAMIIGAIGFIILFFWWLKVINTRLTVTNERVAFRKGILSKNIHSIFLLDIRSVQINQRFMQRLFGTGHVEISSAGSGMAEISIDGIPNAYDVKSIIDKHRRQDKTEKVANDGE
ncbi:PH domain-containing protein [Candidatus Marithioploca araucensis]|uniref:PH domain-containing protein n=1 Tax=Candidatus Marithioploca araucensis TaxID=70273 RepID=A0ABT7VQP4_9GAMM|nr:PH domain-containing protein [Candidatus Marithioploca araucensis]